MYEITSHHNLSPVREICVRRTTHEYSQVTPQTKPTASESACISAHLFVCWVSTFSHAHVGFNILVKQADLLRFGTQKCHAQK